MEIQFYHLLTTPVEVAIPRLMPKVLAAGFISLVKCRDEAQLRLLDENLWTQDPDSFLPHGRADEDKAEMQPILLSLDMERLNQADLMIVLDGTELLAGQQQGITRIVDMFDGGNEAEVNAARNRWRNYKTQGHVLSYFRQQQGGGWKKEN